jgi:RNA recognition motif-containing protein
MGSEPEQNRKVFIGGLNYKTTEAGLREFYR